MHDGARAGRRRLRFVGEFGDAEPHRQFAREALADAEGADGAQVPSERRGEDAALKVVAYRYAASRSCRAEAR